MRIWIALGLFAVVLLFSGCQNGWSPGGGNEQQPAQDLRIQWDITGLEGGSQRAVQVCLEMTYAGEQKFSGEAALEDDVGEQLGGVQRAVQGFSSDLFVPRGSVRYYRVCPAGEEFITYQPLAGSPLKKIMYSAFVRIAKSEQGYSSMFCIPGSILEEERGCPRQTNVGFPGFLSLGAGQVKFTQGERGKKIIAVIPIEEKCDLVKANVEESGRDEKGKGLSASDVEVSLRESGVQLRCGVENVEGTEKRKTIKCEGDVDTGELRDDALAVQLQYGCVYKMQRDWKFGETFTIKDVEESVAV